MKHASLPVLFGVRLIETLAAGLLLFALPISVSACGQDPAGSVALLLFAFGATLAAAQPLVGLLLARGLAPLVSARCGFTLLCISSAAFAFLEDFAGVLSLRVLQGAGTALIVPALLVAVTAGDPVRRGATLGLYSTLRMAGFGASPLVAGALLSIGSLEFLYLLVAALCACGALLLSRRWTAAHSAGAAASVSEAGAPLKRPDPPGHVAIALLAFGAFAVGGSATALTVLSGEYLENLHFAPIEFGAALSAMLIARLALEWGFGRLADRVQSALLPGAGLLLLAAGTLGLALARAPAATVGCRVVMGIGAAMFATPALLRVTRGGRAAALGAAMISSGFAAGVAVGPLLTGRLAFELGREPALAFWGFIAMVSGLAIAVPIRQLALVVRHPGESRDRVSCCPRQADESASGA